MRLRFELMGGWSTVLRITLTVAFLGWAYGNSHIIVFLMLTLLSAASEVRQLRAIIERNAKTQDRIADELKKGGF